MTTPHAQDLLNVHFMNPRNVGELPGADAVGDVGNPLCGDMVRLYLKIKGDKIEKATFKTFGCRASIATSSILTEMLPGRTIHSALKITEQDFLKILGDLPPLKRHCGKLAELALQGALGDYFAKTKGDRTLLDTVADRVRDRREWIPEAAGDEDVPASSPL